MDSVDRQSEFGAKNRLNYPLLADVKGVVAQQFGVKRQLDFLKVKRATFVVGQDRRIVEVIASEMNMEIHGDRAMAALRALEA